MSELVLAKQALLKDRVLQDAALVMEQERIGFIGPRSALPEKSFERVHDYGDALIMPGLVNTHTHAAMTLLRGVSDDVPLKSWLEDYIWPAEERMGPEEVYWGSLLACLEMIASGTTTFSDMYVEMGRVAQAAEESGMRAILARGLQDGPGAVRAFAETRELFAFCQSHAEGRLSTMVGPHAPYTCPPAFLEKTAELADALGIGVHIHLAETRGEVAEAQARWGKSPFQVVEEAGLTRHPVVAAHAVHVPPADIQRLASWRGGVAHCPYSNLKLGAGIAPIAKLRAAGVKVGLGTDGAASGNDLDGFETLRLALLLAKGQGEQAHAQSAWDALAMATSEGAEVLSLGDRIGRLEPGYQADLCVVQAARVGLEPEHPWPSRLAYVVHGTDVVATYVAGRLLYEHGRFLTLDQERIVAKAREAAARVRG